MIKHFHRLESQQSRLLENFKFVGVYSSLPWEKLVFQLNSKMLDVLLQLEDSKTSN